MPGMVWLLPLLFVLLPASVTLPARPLVPPVTLPARPFAPPVTAYAWPLAGQPVVTRRFEPPPQRWLAGHRGVDLGAGPGVPVRAAGAGVVVFAGPVAGRGVVSVAHAGGLRTTYEPVVAAPGLRAGEAVRAGEPIGALAAGHAGCPVAACLHWGLRRGGDYLDPLLLLGAGRVRLLPVAGAAPVGGSASVGGSVSVAGSVLVGGSVSVAARFWSAARLQPAVRSSGRRSASRSYSSARL